MPVKTIFLLIMAYVLGGIPTGYIVVKLAKNTDIRKHGSGNIGFANVYRSAGPVLGVLVLVIDAVKGFVAAYFLATFLEPFPLYRFLFGVAAIAGNVLNPFMRFKGGKGAGTGLGVAAAVSPFALLAAIVVFGAVLAAWRYVSVSSLAGAAVFLASNALLYLYGPADRYGLMFAALLFVVITIRHISNMKRLLNGEENKIGT